MVSLLGNTRWTSTHNCRDSCVQLALKDLYGAGEGGETELGKNAVKLGSTDEEDIEIL